MARTRSSTSAGEVSYVGSADVREIGTGEDVVTFNAENNWTVEAKDIPKALEDVIRESHSDEFVFGDEEGRDETLEEKEARAAALAELNQHQPPPPDA